MLTFIYNLRIVIMRCLLVNVQEIKPKIKNHYTNIIHLQRTVCYCTTL